MGFFTASPRKVAAGAAAWGLGVRTLGYVALQHREELAQLSVGFRLRSGVVKAGVQVRVDDGVAEGLPRAPGGNDLKRPPQACFLLRSHANQPHGA
jgi:hypothetical protein